MEGETTKIAPEAQTKTVDETPVSASDADEVEDGPPGGILSRLFGFWSRATSNEDLAQALENGHRVAVNALPRARREMIERVIAFDEKRVVDVMAPRADIVAIDADTTLDELMKAFAEAGHSRMPIYRGDLDNPLGMVHIKDVVALVAKPSEAQSTQPILKQIRRELLYVPPSMRIMDLLLRMQASRIHMALVIDEYGGTDGLVTIEDLVEEIVGDINDEHDDAVAQGIVVRPDGWDVAARVELSEFAETTGVVFPTEPYEEVDTLGGLVFSLAGRVPQRGEVLSHPLGFDFEVTDADARKIRKIRIRRRAEPKDPPEASA